LPRQAGDLCSIVRVGEASCRVELASAVPAGRGGGATASDPTVIERIARSYNACMGR